MGREMGGEPSYAGHDPAAGSVEPAVPEQREPDLAVRVALAQQREVALLGQRALRGMPEAELLDRAVDAVADQLRVEFVGILVRAPGDDDLVMAAGRGWPDGVVGTMRVTDAPDTQVGAILETGEPNIVEDTELETRFRFSQQILALGVRSSIGARIRGHEGPLGVIGALSTRPRMFSTDETAFLQAVANVVGAAMAVERSEQQRRAVLSASLRSIDEERARIATELHDDTVQVLTATLLSLDRQARRAGDQGQTELAAGIQDARDILAAATERARRLMFELRPPLLHTVGPVAALTELLGEIAIECGFESHVSATLGRLPEDVETLVYRTVAELLSNVRKHANAHVVTLTLTRQDDHTVTGEVADDGVGFDPRRTHDRHGISMHIGLESTAERLQLAGGTLTIDSTPGSGARISFRIPIHR